MPITIFHEDFDSKVLRKVFLQLTSQIAEIISKELLLFWDAFLEIEYSCLEGFITPKWLTTAKKVNFDLCMYLRSLLP